jgi:hypothetical protein
MKSREELHQELRQRILGLSGVTERPNAGIHEDAFFVRGKQGYVTFMARDEKDLAPAMELIQLSHDHFAGDRQS